MNVLSKRIVLPIAMLIALLSQACVSLIELEEENLALRSRIDSLEIQLAEFRSHSDLVLDRLAAIERENLQLDDKNKQLTARLAESLHYNEGHPPASSTIDIPTAEDVYIEGTLIDAVDSGDTPVVADAQSSLAAPPSYRHGVAPDLEFLGYYQTALSAYNSGRYEEAYRAFEHLLREDKPNDMVDNCLYWMGEAAMKSGKHEIALQCFTQTLKCTGTDKEAAAKLGRARALLALAKNTEARRVLEQVRQEHRGSNEAEEALRLLRSLR